MFLSAARYYGDGKRERKLSPFLLESLGQDTLDKQLSLSTTLKNDMFQTSFLTQPSPHFTTPSHKVTYLSYSQIQTFDTCPLHYKLKYILNVPTPLSPSLSFGMSVHSVLKAFYQLALDQEKVSVSDVSRLLKKYWIYEGYENKLFEQEAFKHAEKIITVYLQTHFDSSTLPLSLELPFQFPLSSSLKIGGRIDRIDKGENNTLHIIDYKTGTSMLKASEVQKNLQLSIYALALSKMHDKTLLRDPKDIQLSLHYLEKNLILSTSRTDSQLQKVSEELISKAIEIENSDFACSHSMLCQNCEYHMLCNNKII